MAQMPRDDAFDSTSALLSEGYRFIPERCRRLRSDVFEARLMLRRVVCMSGEEAAVQFYEPGRFTRRGAMPRSTLKLLQDEGSVAVLDGEAHRWRKRMFMSLMTQEAIRRLGEIFEDRWRSRMAAWEKTD